MPSKIYMPEEKRPGGGLAFTVSWENIEDYLRGKNPRHHTSGYNGKPALNPDEKCEFVVAKDGITVYVEKC